ncbi:transposase [Micromonospora yasonensis]|uniref:transposase n=1 Tax=Micromonospora yasonensis TaxID=1128667 RepID=UPI00222EC801|nr:transposase [Micromonospora yasonensis]MCW3844267.1 transposase [Micromonospora yasonensis]
MKVTRIAYSARLNPGKYAALVEQARRLGRVRSEVWQRYGSMLGVGSGLRDRQVRDRQAARHRALVRTEIFTAVHEVVDKAATVIAEDLTKRFTGRKKLGKNINRRLAAWTKGITAEALKNVSERRGSAHVPVNAAYTSQTCHRCGAFGRRDGDRFHCISCGWCGRPT